MFICFAYIIPMAPIPICWKKYLSFLELLVRLCQELARQVEATVMSISWWMDRHREAHPAGGTLAINRSKALTPATHRWTLNTECQWRKPGTRDDILHFMKCPEQAGLYGQKNRFWRLKAGGNVRIRAGWINGCRLSSLVMKCLKLKW